MIFFYQNIPSFEIIQLKKILSYLHDILDTDPNAARTVINIGSRLKDKFACIKPVQQYPCSY